MTREFMRERGLDLLLVGGFRSRDHYEHYLSNDYIEGAVVFPIAENPVAVTWAGTRIHRAEDSFARGMVPWITDYRIGSDGGAVAGLIKDLSQGGKIGVVGLDTQTAGEFSGFIPARFWLDLTAGLSGREIADVSWDFNEMMLPKSAEELTLLRWAGSAAEAAGQVMLDVVAPGVPETEIYAEILATLFRRGCGVRYPTLILNSGYPSLSWGPPRWTTTAEPPRRIAARDLVMAEIFPTYGNAEVQVQMSIAVGKPDPVVAQCAAVARASYEAGLSVLRAGITFGELVRAMEQPLLENGCWALTPLVHSLNPQAFLGFTRVRQQDAATLTSLPGPPPRNLSRLQAADLVLPAGTTLAFEPNACIERTRVVVGGTIIVTDDGYEEVNSLSCRMHVMDV
ncbi:Xaa-Pro peptidase family protein [Amycolatopsis sp. GM8]|uniref:M24 family metallopeptidase n=1 Tax=Amycolatopsis sp. GM8 TaxID=2896530 RepID=UPI001F18C1C4|nr:M24 family metallopeptidase [Amycolatopsis sp. GM8]